MFSLQTIYHRLCRRFDIADQFFKNVKDDWNARSRYENWALGEGLVSVTWQLWSMFCRQLIMASAMGCITRSGNVLTPCLAGITDERMAYLARCAVRKVPPKPGKTLTLRRLEPTWGNQNVMLDVVNCIHPQNERTLISAFGLPVRGPFHLQTVRNATAHLNNETLQEVKKLCIYYQNGQIRHPIDLTIWTDNNTSTMAFWSWTDDMRTLGDQATH